MLEVIQQMKKLSIFIHMKHHKYFFPLFIISYISISSIAQTGVITGTVQDKFTQESIIGASVNIEGTELGTITNETGFFKITNIIPKTYNIRVSYIGYEEEIKYNVIVTSGNVNNISIFIQEVKNELSEVVISSSKSIQVSNIESPLSIQNLGIEEIKNNPGGNFDISKVVNTLPGVSGTAGGGNFRNDLIIRGGGPSENVFYLDGVEIPVINHFTTQGASGGPTGMINVSFIEDVTLMSSAFPAKYDNAVSSVLQFKQKEGNTERIQGNLRLSASEIALTAEGPLGSKTTFLASARRSYLQFLFKLIGLPIRPNYWDFQYKVNHKFNTNLSLTAIGIGAIDDFSFAKPEEATPENLYVLTSSPSINQWNYSQGFSLKKINKKSYWYLTFSRNMLDNSLDKFSDNFNGKQEDVNKRTLGIKSQEVENKLRFENNLIKNDWKLAYGAACQYAEYYNDSYLKIKEEERDLQGNIIQPTITSSYKTEINLIKYGLFSQISKNYLQDKLGLSFGLRLDGNTNTNNGNKLWNTTSPRLNLTYALIKNLKTSISLGRYFKLPIYPALGFKNIEGKLVNNTLDYLKVDHVTGGVEWLPNQGLRITAEGFYKNYSHYPVATTSGLSLANQGADFGIIGNEQLNSNGKGRSYGMEIYLQQKLVKKTFLVASYTLFWSKFSGQDQRLIPSSWDNRHLLSLTAGQKLGANWELGIKYRYQGGTPYTPIDVSASKKNYLLFGRETLNYDLLNTERLAFFNQLDIRLDKKWNFKKWTLDLFLDLQNVTNAITPQYPTFTLKRNQNNDAFETTNGLPLSADGSNAIPIILGDDEGQLLPTIGFIVEF
jgi:hypothetical protein